MKKYFFTIISWILLSILFISCDDSVKDDIPSLKLSVNDTLIQQGKGFKIDIRFSNAVSAVNDYVWTTSNNSIVTINDNGSITAVSPGLAIIKVMSKDNFYIDSCIVNVGVGDERYIVYPKNIDGISQLICKDLESKDEKQITYSETNVSIISYYDNSTVVYKIGNALFSQKMGVYIEYANIIESWGDSLTAGAGGNGTTYPNALASMLNNLWSVNNNGIGGQISTSIAMRQGGVPFYVTLENNTIPASGTFKITGRNGNPITDQGSQSLSGYIEGVKGTLQRLTDNSYIFTRGDSGEEKTVSSLVQFIPDNDIKRDRITIIWYGRNNILQKDIVLSDIQSSINYLRTDRYIVMSITNARYEPSSTIAHTQIVNLNRELENSYKEKYLDIRKILVNSYDPNNDEEAEDFKVDLIPESLMATDGLHFNAKGYTIIAESVLQKLKELGYI
ncbi:Ig-like domain-containing protein [Dysgonomonas reticulitermitis]